MIELEFYRDSGGAPCAKGDDNALAVFLETDLQDSIAVTDSLIDLLRGDAGASADNEFNGNAHSVTVDKGFARIASTADDQACERVLTIELLHEYLCAWREFILST